MGTTTTYGIPYPEDEDLVKDGATAMQSLAEEADAAILGVDSPPFLVLTGADTDSGADNRIAWDVDDPAAIIGDWTFPPGAGAFIIPPRPGLYLVILAYKLDPTVGAGGGTYTYTARIQRKVSGADQATAVTAIATTQVVDGEDGPRVPLSGIVRIDDTADLGIQIQITVPEGDAVLADTGGRLQILYVGRP